MPESSDFLCGNWAWDEALRELRYFERKGKGWKDEPEAVERLQRVKSVTWHRWSQLPMTSTTGQVMGSQMSRVVAAYEGGGDLTVNEADRGCARKLAEAISGAFGLPVIEAGAPTGRRGGNLPGRDRMGRLVSTSGRTEVVLDEVAGEILVITRKRVVGKSRRSYRTSELRRLEVGYEVQGPLERYTVWAVAGPDEERLALSTYQGYEGWADPEEWRELAAELGQRLGVEVRAGDLPA